MRHFTAVVLASLGLLGLASSVLAQPPARAESRPIVFEIRVPGDAQLEIEGAKTTTPGENRQFKTPDVPLGRRYAYTVKVTYQGKTTSHQMTLTHAGPNVLDLRRELTAGKPLPKGAGGFELVPVPSVTVRPGDAAPVSVRIRRENLTEAVEVTFRGLPAGVKINDATIPAGKDEQSALLMSEKEAQPGVSTVEVTARAGRVLKQATFRLTIAATAPPPRPEGPVKKDDKPKTPPADLPNDPPPTAESKKPTKPPEPAKKEPKPPPADLPNDPPPGTPPADTKKPPAEPKKPEPPEKK